MEDSQKITEQGNEVLIEEMLRGADKADLPSDLTNNPVINRGDATLEAPMTVKEITDAGRVWIWDTRTYLRAPCLGYMLTTKLHFKREDGSFRWTTRDPGKKPTRGSVKCLLHPETENREHFNELGFRICKKDNVTNPYQLKQHMIKKHPQEWAAIEEEKRERERQEDRELQKLLLSRQAEKPPVYVSAKDKQKEK